MILKKVMGLWYGSKRSIMDYGGRMSRINWVLIYGWSGEEKGSIYVIDMRGSGNKGRDMILEHSIMLMVVGMLDIG